MAIVLLGVEMEKRISLHENHPDFYLLFYKLDNKNLVSKDIEFTDESSAIKNIGEDIFYIKGDIASKKLTFFEDISQITCLKAPAKTQFVGIGYDIHSFEGKKEMFLGGVK